MHRRVGGSGTGRGIRRRHSDQPSRPRLRGRAILQHGLGHRPRRQQAARRDQARRSPARQFQPALQGAGARPRHGLFARSPHARGGLDRIEFGDLHRHRDQFGEACHLCRPFAARSLLHARRQGSLGHRPRRELRRRARCEDLCRKDPHHHAERTGHADLLPRRQVRLHLLVLQSGDRRRHRRRPQDHRQG